MVNGIVLGDCKCQADGRKTKRVHITKGLIYDRLELRPHLARELLTQSLLVQWAALAEGGGEEPLSDVLCVLDRIHPHNR